MKTKIEVDTRTFVRFWLVVIGFGVAGFLLYGARSALIILGIALFLALAINPLVGRLARIIPGKTGQSRVLSTALAYVTVVALLGAFVLLAVPPIIQQTAKLVEKIPGLVNDATTQNGGISQVIHHYNLQPQVESALSSLKDSATSIATGLGKNLVNSLSSVFAFIGAGILVLVLTFFMLVEGPTWMENLWRLYTDKEKMRYHKKVVKKMYNVVTSYVNGQLIVSALDGLFAGLAVFILSLIFNIPASFAIPAAAIMFVFSLIPMFGALLGAVLVALIIAFNAWPAAVIYLIYVIIYQQVESSYISPKVQSRKIDLSPLAILGSVTIGIYLFGIAGGIISIPIAGIIKILVEEYLNYRKEKDAEEENEEQEPINVKIEE
jgi:predicted PurR-regulated permease PerM